MLKGLAAGNDLNNTVFPPALFAIVALAFLTGAFFSPFNGKTRVCFGLVGIMAVVICVGLIKS